MRADRVPAVMNRLIDPAERVIELLAIELFKQQKHLHCGWLEASEEEREDYRKMARGEEPLWQRGKS